MSGVVEQSAKRRNFGGNTSTGSAPNEAQRRAIVIHPEQRYQSPSKRPKAQRDAAASLEEACGLAIAIGLVIAHREVITLAKLRPATLLGAGKIEELAAIVQSAEAELLIVDSAVSPVQQRNLEKAVGVKVIDRTGLILEIFGERARTKEGVLQVELAHLSYQQSRLVRTWTHLERQRGGFGFMGGPGETQIETDRRLIRDRIARLKKQLAEVQRTRSLHRKERKKVPYPIVALVGYTNAGKSTLFNRLTAADVTAEDMLFATLDPTLRMVETPAGRHVILSDTVGFISDLPTQLVAAFRATLEEVTEADLLLHIRDISHKDHAAQKQDVMDVLEELGVAGQGDESKPIIEIHNKIDVLEEDGRAALFKRCENHLGEELAVSASTGENCADIFDAIDAFLDQQQLLCSVRFPVSDGALYAWLHKHGHVRAVETTEDGHFTIRLYLSAQDIGALSKKEAVTVEPL